MKKLINKFKLKHNQTHFGFRSNQINKITEMGYTLGLALVINIIGSQFTLALFPQGGAIGVYPVLLMLFAWRWGWKSSLILNVVYGCMTLILPGTVIISFYQLTLGCFLGYVPFTLVIISRRWIIKTHTAWWKVILAFILGPLLAFTCSFIISFWAGVWFYSQYLPSGEGIYIYSLTYNGTSVLGTSILSITVLLMGRNQFVRLIKAHT